MSGCPGPKDMGGVVRARQTIGPTASLVAMLPARLEAGGWMVWMEAVAAPGVFPPPAIEVNLDMGRFVQARQFTIPGGGFRVYTVPSNVPVTVRATSRGVTTPATLAAWPVDQVAWANPEFEFPTATNPAPGANFIQRGSQRLQRTTSHTEKSRNVERPRVGSGSQRAFAYSLTEDCS